MSLTDREKIMRHLYSVHSVTPQTEANLINALTDCGLISDETIDRISDSDLLRAYNRSFEE